MIRPSWLYFRQRWAARLLRPLLWLHLLVRWLVYLVSATLSLASLFVLLAFLWMFVSEPGGGWLLRQAPGVMVEGFSGHLINNWQAEQLSWQGESQAVILTDLDVQWQPWCLLRFAICLNEVEASQLKVQTGLGEPQQTIQEPPQDQGWETFRMPEVSLPELSLPWPMTVKSIKLDRFLVNGGQHFQQLTLKDGRWQGTRVEWSQLNVQSRWVPLDSGESLAAEGQLDMQGDWPLQVKLQGRLQNMNFNAEVKGSLQHLELTRMEAEGLPVRVSGQLALFNPKLPMQFSLQAIELPVAAYWKARQQPQPDWLSTGFASSLIDHLHLDFSGNLEQGWKLEALGQLLLDQQPLLLDLDADLDFSGIYLQELQLSRQQQQQMRLSGEVDWNSLVNSFSQGPEALTAHLKLDWQNFFGSEFPWHLWMATPPVLPWQQERLQLEADLVEGQLSLDAELVTDLLLKQDELHLDTRLQAKLPISHLVDSWPDTSGQPNDPLYFYAEWLAWAEALELELEGHLAGNLNRLDYSFTAGLDFAFQWQGPQHSYLLDLSQISLEGPGNEYLKARLKMTSDSWQARVSSRLTDLALLTEPWFDGMGGDLVLTAQASVPSLWSGGPLLTGNENWRELLLQGNYRARASAGELHWTSGHLKETALAMEYSGLMKSLPLGEQPVKLKAMTQQLQLDGFLPVEQLSMQLEGVVREQQLRLDARYADQPLKLNLKGGWQLQAMDGMPLAYELQPFDLEQISYFLPDNLRWLGDVGGSLQLGLQPEGLLMDWQLNAGSGELGIYQMDEINQTEEWTSFQYQELTFGLSLRPNFLQTDWQLAGEQLGKSEVMLRLDWPANSYTGKPSLSGLYKLENTDLQLLLPFLDVDDVGGRLQGQGELRGHLQAPEVWGNLQLEGVTATNVRWPVSLNHLDAAITLEAHQAYMTGDFQAGRHGRGQLKGQLSWQDDLQGEMAVAGQHIDVRVEPWANLELHPDLTLSFKAGQVHLGGLLEIPSGNIEVQRLPQQAVRISTDARVKNRPEPEPSLVTGFKMDLELLVGRDRLELNAFGLEADLEGRLRLSDNLDARGELLLVRGIYESFGQDLRLRRARLTFSGPVDLPFLDVEAVRDIAPGLVGIRITGRVDQPETEIFSEPAMSNEQALSWLLTGAPLEAGTDINALALSMGLASLSSYTSAVGEAVGVREFELSTEGEGDEASLVAAGYLNRRLSIRYGVGIYEDISRVAIRYELTRQFYVEVVSSIENSLDVFWEVDY